MKKYFLYELKKSAPAIGYLTLAVTAVYLLPLLTVSLDGYVAFSGYATFQWLLSTLAGGAAALIPIWKFSYRTKKRSVDLYYSLPLSHKKILTVKFAVGLIALYGSYSVAFWLGALTGAVKFGELINSVYYIPQYFASLIPLFIIYVISAFAFTRANKRVDGVFFIFFWMSALSVIIQLLDRMFGITGDSYGLFGTIMVDYFSPSSPLDSVTTYFQTLLANEAVVPLSGTSLWLMIIGLIVNFLLAAGATAGLFLLENKTKAENAGQISESLFGYKVMIPLFTVCYIALSFSEFVGLNVVFVVLIALMSSAVTILYRRTIKIGWKQTAIFAASVIFGIILGVLCNL